MENAIILTNHTMCFIFNSRSLLLFLIYTVEVFLFAEADRVGTL